MNDATAANQQLLVPDPDEEDAEFIAGLTKKQKRRLEKKLVGVAWTAGVSLQQSRNVALYCSASC
jgi:hypothetical protein